jgi:hypothetical protein
VFDRYNELRSYYFQTVRENKKIHWNYFLYQDLFYKNMLVKIGKWDAIITTWGGILRRKQLPAGTDVQ